MNYRTNHNTLATHASPPPTPPGTPNPPKPGWPAPSWPPRCRAPKMRPAPWLMSRTDCCGAIPGG